MHIVVIKRDNGKVTSMVGQTWFTNVTCHMGSRWALEADLRFFFWLMLIGASLEKVINNGCFEDRNAQDIKE